MDLAQHTDQPTDVTVGKRTFAFGELTLELGGKLQQWIKDHIPSPMRVVRENLDGFAADDRATLLNAARREMAAWPPVVGTGEAARILGGSPAGQVETIYVGLLKHQPGATRADAEWIWRKIRRDEATSTLIYGLIFGNDDEDDAPDDPKG